MKDTHYFNLSDNCGISLPTTIFYSNVGVTIYETIATKVSIYNDGLRLCFLYELECLRMLVSLRGIAWTQGKMWCDVIFMIKKSLMESLQLHNFFKNHNYH
jgi:hypothetical protein